MIAPSPTYPRLYQINTRVWLKALSAAHGMSMTLADVPDEALDQIAERGFDWVWLLSVWRTGEAGRAVSRQNPEWRAEFEATLPDLQEADICGSGFAIAGYTVADGLGGPQALAQIRSRLAARGLRLMLDFVPNHTGLDHPWVETHSDFYISGTDDDLTHQPQNWIRRETSVGTRVLAYGRDPYFSGWPDTLQLNYANPNLRTAQVDELLAIAEQCDGVRCDMAMLVLPSVFEATWGAKLDGGRPEPFWPEAIETVRAEHPGFVFMAEVYWDLEWELQQQGFDYCYDKRLYDRLHNGAARPVRDHLLGSLEFQSRLARFLENHDEPRAATTFSDVARHRAAAAITFLTPGLRLFHQGQFQGWRTRISPHLCRGPNEQTDDAVAALYDELLILLKDDMVLNGDWWRLEPEPVGDSNQSFDQFVAFAWQGRLDQRLLIVVNYNDNWGQCRISLPFTDLRGRQLTLTDQMTGKSYARDGDELVTPGLYVDHGPWQVAAFVLGDLTD